MRMNTPTLRRQDRRQWPVSCDHFSSIFRWRREGVAGRCPKSADACGPGVVRVRRKTVPGAVIIAACAAGVLLLLLVVWRFAGSRDSARSRTGSGSGAVAVSDGTTPLVVRQASPAVRLYPGGPAATLRGTFDNPNSKPVLVHQVVATVAAVTGARRDAAKPACTVLDFALTGSPTTVDASVSPGRGRGSWGPMRVSMRETGHNQDNCRWARVQITYALR
jgi:hypothetical protein